MSVNKYNSEGYNDPTTYEALTNIDKQDKAAKKAAHFCLSESIDLLCTFAVHTVERLQRM